jgi:CheY-like chemotaxis protein
MGPKMIAISRGGPPGTEKGDSGRMPVAPTLEHPSVLVVDDDPGIRETIANILRDERYVVATAGNGQSALDLMNGGLRPNAILLDIWMPGLDGLAVMAAMKRDPLLADIPVIVLTAGVVLDPEIHRVAATVLRKPVDLDVLLATVELHAIAARTI